MAHPTAHEVQDLTPCGEELPVQLRDRRYGGLVYVRDEPGRLVELLVRRLVRAPEGFFWNLDQVSPLSPVDQQALNYARPYHPSVILRTPAWSSKIWIVRADHASSRRVFLLSMLDFTNWLTDVCEG